MLTTIALVAVLVAPQQPARDTSPKPAAGTATVSGTVVSDEAEPRPVRRVRVSLIDPERRTGTTIVTDETGRFTFRNIAPGRYQLTASRSGWVSIPYGATRAGRPGTPLTLAQGQQIDRLTLRIARGAVLTGTLTDEYGQPMARTTVNAMRYAYISGSRSLVPAGSAMTDDRGVYRIFGLAAGQYLIASSARSGPMMHGTELRQTTDGEIARALAEGRRSGQRSDAPAASSREDAPRTVGYAPVFYPGTPVAAQATAISVNAGDERGGLDFQLSMVPTSRIDGVVVDPSGVPLPNSTINLVASEPGLPGFGFDHFRMGRSGPQGQFSFAGLPPGKYTILSRGGPPSQGGAAAPPPPSGARPDMTSPPLWARTDVALDGHPVSGLTLLLQPGLTLSGRVQFSGTLQPPDPTRMRVSLMPAAGRGQVNLGVAAVPLKADGTFTISGIAPGAYRVSSGVPGARPDAPGWVLASAVVNGRDTLDSPVEIGQNIHDAVLTFSDRPTELTGILQDPAGRPAPEYYIVVFSADRQFWTPMSRRTRAVRPSAEGRFNIRNLPAGDYLIAAVADIENGEWDDPVVLQQLSGAAMAIALAEGEKKAQDIQVGSAR